MRYIKEKAINFFGATYDLILNLTKSELFVAGVTGSATVYYIGKGTAPYLGNVPAFTLGSVVGGMVGLGTVYCSEKDELNLTLQLKTQLKNEFKIYEEKRLEYLSLRNEKEILDRLQIQYQKIDKLLQLFEIAFQKQLAHETISSDDLTVKITVQRGRSSTCITGDLRPRPQEHEFPVVIDLWEEEIKPTDNENLTYIQRMCDFFKGASKARYAAMLSNAAIIFYYVQFSLKLIVEFNVAIPVGVICGVIGGPLLVRFTSQAALNNNQKLQNKLSHIKNQNELLRVSIEELRKEIQSLREQQDRYSLISAKLGIKITGLTQVENITPATFFNEFKLIKATQEAKSEKSKKIVPYTCSPSSFSYSSIFSSSDLTGTGENNSNLVPLLSGGIINSSGGKLFNV